MRVVSVKMPHYLLELIDAFAAARGLSRSEVLREAVLEYLRGREALRPQVRVRRVVLE